MPQIDEENSSECKLDVKDKKIIKILKENSRESYTKISKRVMLSKDSVAYRIKRLEKLKVIDRYSIDIKYRLLGFEKYHILFQLLESDQKEKEKFYDYLIKNENVINIILYSDKWDLKVKILAKGALEFDKILTEINNKFSHLLIDYEIMQEIRNYESSKSKETILPKLDETDKKIIKLLMENSKATFVEISNKTNLGADAIIYRMNKYKKYDLIRKYTAIVNVNKMGFHWYEMLFLMKLFSNEEEEKLVNLIKKNENIIKIIKTIGNWNVVFTILAKSPKEFHETAKMIRTIFKENVKDYDTLLAYEELEVKESQIFKKL